MSTDTKGCTNRRFENGRWIVHDWRTTRQVMDHLLQQCESCGATQTISTYGWRVEYSPGKS